MGDNPPYMNFMCTRDAEATPFTLICFGGLKLHSKYSSYVFQYVCVLIILYLEVFFILFIMHVYFDTDLFLCFLCIRFAVGSTSKLFPPLFRLLFGNMSS